MERLSGASLNVLRHDFQRPLRDDSQRPLDELWAEIESRFGICPSFFKLGQPYPPIAWHVFRMTESAYLDNPIPGLFKDKLFTWLSRLCDVRYCVARHCAFLLRQGVTAEQALALLNEPMPGKEQMPEYLRALEQTPTPLEAWPEFESESGRRIRMACAVTILDPGQAGPWLQALRRLLGPERYGQIMFFLAFVRTAHFWVRVHPELEFEPDLSALLHEHEMLAEAFLRRAGEADRWELGPRLYDELQSLRRNQESIEAIRDSEARFKAIFKNTAVGIYRVGMDSRLLEVNQRMCDILGYSREELMAKSFFDITHPDDLEGDWTAARRLLEHEADTYMREKRYCRKDGSVVWANVNVSLLRKPGGSPDYFVSIVEDISARKRAEQNLREREERVLLASRAAGLGLFEWDVQADRAVWENDRMYEIFGHTRADGPLSKAQLVDRYMHSDDAAVFERALAGGMKSGTPFHTVYRIRRKDGALRWLELAGNFQLASDGTPIRMIGVLADITERQHTEETLRASEERFRALADTAPVMIWISGTDKLCTFFNKAWLDFTGRTMEMELGNGWSEGVHAEDFPRCLETYVTCFEARKPFKMEYRLRRYDGEYRWVLDHGIPRFSSGGDFLGYIGSCIDITERREIERALRESESRFRQLAESLPQLVWTCRVDGWCDYISPQYVDYTGVPEAGQLGFGWLQQVHPDDRERVLKGWGQTMAGDSPFSLECRLRRRDGVYRWFKSQAVGLRDSSGQIIKWFGSDTDIDDQKKALQALAESEERLAGIVSSAMDAIITVDEDQRVVLFNEAAQRMFHCRAGEALGKPLAQFIPERFRQAYAEHIRGFTETGSASRPLRRLGALSARRSDDTEFPIEASISSVRVGGKRLYTFILRDITEREQAEIEREQLSREQAARAVAEAANRSKDEFLAMVSHELRSPLNAILGYTRILRSGPGDRDAINKAIAVIERGAKAQLQIIEDLLDSARIVTGKLRIEPGPVDLVPVLEAALDTVSPAASAKGVTLVANFGPQPEEALGDSTRLQQIVWNLLSNAVKFTPEGGRVELRIEHDADHIRIIVSDSGKGIDPAFLPFVFERFSQADASSARRFGGLGLGLSLVKHLVELHGGTITAASEGLGRGSTFTVTLPRRQPEFVSPLPAVAPLEVRREGAIVLEEAPSLEDVSVLVVDDQEEARVLLTQALNEYGAQVTAVPSGSEALALLEAPPGGRRPDVLILDIAMPDEDGYEVLKKVRALEARRGDAAGPIPAVALTAYGRSEDRLRALQEGFQMHVAKPVEPAELAVVIASLTSQSPWGPKGKPKI
jgi:PAS domain S-box-containing protein